LREIVVFDNVTVGYKYYGGISSLRAKTRIVLRNISFRLHSGERLAIIGESGAGKTTIIKNILGLLKPLSGRILVFGNDIYGKDRGRLKEVYRKIGYVPQNPGRALNPRMEILDIMAEPLEAQGLEWDVIEEKARRIARLVHLNEKVLSMYPDQLSGGMQQRVLIARALIHDPELLILDEPTSALDVSIQAQIINLINEIYSKTHLAILLVTHDLAVAQHVAERAIVLRKGVIVEEGSMDEIIHSPKHEYTRLLIESYAL
jgi:ABC-type glutathione transport system ATPase component